MRVGAGVGLFAVNPEDLGAGFLDNFALLLDGGGIDPVLCVEYLAPYWRGNGPGRRSLERSLR